MTSDQGRKEEGVKYAVILLRLGVLGVVLQVPGVGEQAQTHVVGLQIRTRPAISGNARSQREGMALVGTYHRGLQFQILGLALIVEPQKEGTGAPRPLRYLEEGEPLQLFLQRARGA